MKCKHDKGFTLVEVVVALFVVAIISTPLLQMFVTTSYANKGAQVMDTANVIAVQLAETFKSAPESYSSSNGETSYYFYKGDGTRINPTTVYHDLNNIPAEATIMIKSAFPDPTPKVTPSNVAEAGYYPDFAGTIDLSQYSSDIDVTIKENYTDGLGNTFPYIIGVESAGSSFAPLPNQDTSKEKNNILPIEVDYPTEGSSPSFNINVTNESNLEAEFYVFNTNNGSGTTFYTLEGSSSVAYVPVSGTGSDSEFDLTLTASRLNNGVWGEMFTFKTEKHIYN